MPIFPVCITSVLRRYCVGALKGALVSTAVLPLAIGFSAVNAAADPVADATEGCAPIYTLQKAECEVEHVYHCEAPAEPGYIVVTVEEGEPTGMEFTGPDGELAGYQSLGDPGVIRVLETTNEMSVATLRETGEESFAAEVYFAFSTMRFDRVQATGTLVLDGNTRTIGKQRFATGLADLAFDLPGADNLALQWQFLLPETENVVLTGESISAVGGRIIHDRTRILQVLRPGNDGFLVDQGLYDCGEGI